MPFSADLSCGSKDSKCRTFLPTRNLADPGPFSQCTLDMAKRQNCFSFWGDFMKPSRLWASTCCYCCALLLCSTFPYPRLIPRSNFDLADSNLQESLRDQVQQMSLQAMRRLCETPLEERTPEIVEKICIMLQQLTPLFKDTNQAVLEEVCKVMKVQEYQAYTSGDSRFLPAERPYMQATPTQSSACSRSHFRAS
jgi:hypothetical protein